MPTVSASKYLVQAGQHWHRPDREKICVICGVVKALGEFYSSNLQIIPIGINMRKGVKWPK